MESAAPSLQQQQHQQQQRRIEFHLARKPISSSFSNHNSSNFKLETLNPSSPSISSSKSHSLSQPLSSSNSKSNSKNPESSDFIDASFDLDFAFRIPFHRIGAGLENLGNTCFLNSVIQCLTYTEPLVAYLQSGKHQNNCHVAGFCALCAMQKHVNRALQSTGRIVAPKDLVSNLRCISRSFRNARQEDAHEYMINLLESMHKCCLPSGVPAESPGAYDKSLVHKIFGGRLRSQVKCLQCSHCSNTFDPFLDLSLEIIKADSVHKALLHFTAAEQLDGGERQYKCEKCKQKVRALKQLTVYKAPYVLTVHLKRFRHFAGQKIDKKVHFGSSLNLKPFVSGNYEGDLTYTLYGVLVHAGWSTHSGHYYSFVRTSSGLWYSLDDNRVYQVSEKTVMEQKAYMLFYVRDRKNPAPKKALDVVHKENLFGSKKAMDVRTENLITTMRNATSSCSIPVVKSYQNGYTDKNSKETSSSGLIVNHSVGHNASKVPAQQNSSKCVSSIAVAEVKELNHKNNLTMSTVSSVTNKENSSIANMDLDGMVNPATKSSSGDSKKSAKATTSVDCCDNKEKELASIEKPSILNCPSNAVNVLCNKESHEIGTPAGTKVQNTQSSNVNEVKPNVPSDSAIQLTTEDGTRKTKNEASEPTSDIHSVLSKPRIKRPRMNGPSVKSPESAPRQSSMKDILKSSIGGMHFSTKVMYRASLAVRKSRRFKRMKKNIKIVPQDLLPTEDFASVDMGPSTSDSGSVGNSKGCHKKGDSPCVREVKNSGAHCKDVNDSCSKEQSHQPVNVPSASTGLEESHVGCWEGVEPPLERVKSNGQNTLIIGHVLDEWDEEYDRGKRKKVKLVKNTFGGPNVFQEVATKKAKLKVNAKNCRTKPCK
ncbi:ubiquitin carboxyl-terminal hydrolase 23-like [Chenopodium quinoa]|uniref:ubiquitin carboxyl-terminal hydrolase 23-like n=1 Tax=Chenopodium quinoa TaxID=63459 RepID=UPI000B796305|nr:ubiquitin carboxyl-terminal hydrolase 23-like [Chenopodium quinoa]